MILACLSLGLWISQMWRTDRTCEHTESWKLKFSSFMYYQLLLSSIRRDHFIPENANVKLSAGSSTKWAHLQHLINALLMIGSGFIFLISPLLVVISSHPNYWVSRRSTSSSTCHLPISVIILPEISSHLQNALRHVPYGGLQHFKPTNFLTLRKVVHGNKIPYFEHFLGIWKCITSLCFSSLLLVYVLDTERVKSYFTLTIVSFKHEIVHSASCCHF